MQQPIYKNPNVPDTNQIYRTSILVWAAMLFSQLMFLVVVLLARPKIFNFGTRTSGDGSNQDLLLALNPVMIILGVLGLATVAVSFVLKSRMLKLAIDNKQIGLVPTAQILAYALCEATTLFGLFIALAFNSPLFFAWFAVGVTGILLHFPRRNDFAAASFTGIN